jgi:hypothetical protein
LFVSGLRQSRDKQWIAISCFIMARVSSDEALAGHGTPRLAPSLADSWQHFLALPTKGGAIPLPTRQQPPLSSAGAFHPMKDPCIQ